MKKKYICTADIHITLKKDVDEDWQTNRYMKLFDTLVAACVEHDAHLIILGDLFDKAEPTLDDLYIASYLFKFLGVKNIQCYIIAGNHCTIAKNNHTFNYLEHMLPSNVHIMYKFQRINSMISPVQLHTAHHCDLDNTYYREQVEGDWSKHILLTHFRTDVGEYIKEEINTQALCSQFDLVIAGDIHADLEIGNLVYTNQPVNSKFESQSNTGFILLELEGTDIHWQRIKTDLPSLIQVTCDAYEYEQCLSELNDTDFYRIVVTGSMKALRNIKKDKKNTVVQRVPIMDETIVEQAVDVISKNLPIKAQLVEYLQMLSFTPGKEADMIDVLLEGL